MRERLDQNHIDYVNYKLIVLRKELAKFFDMTETAIDNIWRSTMIEKSLEGAWKIIAEQQEQIEELIRTNEAYENNIGKLWSALATSNDYINQLESKQSQLENDLYSLQTTVNRLEGI